MQIPPLGESNQLLDLGLDRLGLGLAGLDPFVLDQLLGEVREQCLAMRRVAAQLVSLLAVAHRSGSAPRSVSLKIEAACVQGLDYFLDRLRAEVRNRVQLRARLANQVADRLHARPLQAVVGTDAELELLDEDLVEAVAAGDAVARRAGQHVRRMGS